MGWTQMRRFKLDLLSPYVSDAAAFLILGVSVAVVLGVAGMKGEVHEATLYQSVTQGFANL
jgi:hypothetical protein